MRFVRGLRKPILALATMLTVTSAGTMAGAQATVDIAAMFAKAEADGQVGTARKTKPVDARPAQTGEVITTVIRGEGKETQSPPAVRGDMVVRNRCAETGNEEILVKSGKFDERYDLLSTERTDGTWIAFRPRGIVMKYFIVPASAPAFSFTAPWGEAMVAKPGDTVVQDPNNPKDTYRIARAAFACTYEIVTPAKAP